MKSTPAHTVMQCATKAKWQDYYLFLLLEAWLHQSQQQYPTV